jgi:hypothetical protein
MWSVRSRAKFAAHQILKYTEKSVRSLYTRLRINVFYTQTRINI